MQTVFCLASGRSGTHFLYEIIRRNTLGSVCRHEPYLWNPSMFGRAIYDRATGNELALRKVAERKSRVIEGFRAAAAYVETSHAFLKSWSDEAIRFFPAMKLVHLVRNPLLVAKSEFVREELIHNWRLPLRNYQGADGEKYFRWALTGKETIFDCLRASIEEERLSGFQWYVAQWIEIENRAMEFLDKHHKHADCFTVHSPHGLNDPAIVQSLLDFLGLPIRPGPLRLQGSKNRTPGVRTTITDHDRTQFAEVIALLPARYLSIFQREPYCRWDWATMLGK